MPGTQIGTSTNFPQGFANGLSVRGMPLLQAQTGKVFYVGNNGMALSADQRAGSDSNRGTFLDPFATLNYAVNTACTQGRGDIVFVLPGHYEAVSAATTLPLACNNVAVIGLGSGAQRPTFILDTAATATFQVRAANISVQNCVFLHNVADITSTFTCVGASVTASVAAGTAPSTVAGVGSVMTVTVVGSGTLYPGAYITGTAIPKNVYIVSQLTGTTGGVGTYQLSQSFTFASGTVTTGCGELSIDSCEFRDLSSALNSLAAVTTTANDACDDGLSFTNNKFLGLGTTANTAIVALPNSLGRLMISGNFLKTALAANSCMIYQATTTKVLTNFMIQNNTCWFIGANAATGLYLITTATTHTGVISGNSNRGTRAIADAVLYTTNTGIIAFQNFYKLIGSDLSGALIPAVQT